MLLLYGKDDDGDEVFLVAECLWCDEWCAVSVDWEDLVDFDVLREGDRVDSDVAVAWNFEIGSDFKLRVDAESESDFFIEEENLWQVVLHRIGTDFSWPIIINGVYTRCILPNKS